MFFLSEVVFCNLMRSWNKGGHWRVVDGSLGHEWHIEHETGLYQVHRSGVVEQWVDWKVEALPLVRDSLKSWTLDRCPFVDDLIREILVTMDLIVCAEGQVRLAAFYCSQRLVKNTMKILEEEVLDDFPVGGTGEKPQWMWTFPFFYAEVA